MKVFLRSLLVVAVLFASIAVVPPTPIAQAAENPPTFERMWPQLSQPWYFDYPYSVAIDPAGNFYVADAGNHRVQKFSSAGTFLASWGAPGSGPGQFNWPEGVAVDSSGNVYVADSNNNRIQKFSGSGSLITAWGSWGTGTGQFSHPGRVAVDSSGNVYVTDSNNNRIQKFTGSGSFITAWGSLGAGAGQFSRPAGIAVDGSGNVYVADSSNNRIQKFTGSGSFITAWGSLGTGTGQFSQPAGIAVDGSGNVYVADSSNNRISKFSSGGSHLGSWGSSGLGPGQFFYPYGVAVDASGNMYVAEGLSGRIQKLSSAGVSLAVWGSSGAGAGQFRFPDGVAVDSAGNVYVADMHNHRIQKFNSLGSQLASWGSWGSGAGQFMYPDSVVVGASGYVYVSDNGNHRIQKFTNSGAYVASWGSFGSGASQFKNLQGVAVDAAENVYVADGDNSRVQKFSSSGSYLTAWGSSGSGAGQFGQTIGVAVDSAGFVYVTDFRRVQKFTLDGTYIGTLGSVGTGAGQFDSPNGIAVDSNGNVYVSEYSTNRVQKFARSGVYLTSWGTLGSSAGQFSEPRGLAVDTNGNIYVAEWSNNRVQKFSQSRPTLLSLVGSNLAPRAGDAITLSGRLAYLSDGSAVPGSVVRLESLTTGGSWTAVGTAVTDSSGNFSASVTPRGTTSYRAVFDGTTERGAATAAVLSVSPVLRTTSLSASLSSLSPRAGDEITVKGRLTEGSTAVSGATVKLLGSPDGSAWTEAGTASTNSLGDYTLRVTPKGDTTYRVVYDGDFDRAKSTADAGRVTPVLRTTSISVSIPSSTPRAGDPITVSGRLTENSTGVGPVQVKLQRSSDGSSWSDVNSVSTNASGDYSFSITPSGATYYRVRFVGDFIYREVTSSSRRVDPVLRQTTLALTQPPSAPVAGTNFSLSGQLSESAGAAAPGATVKIQRSTDGVTWADVSSAVSAASGTFSITTQIPARTRFRAVFAGDMVYTAVTSLPLVIIPVERDDDIAGAGSVSWPVNGSIRDEDDPRDVYRIDIADNTTTDLTLTGAYGPQLGIDVFGPGTQSVSAGPVGSAWGGSLPVTLRYEAPAAGTFYVAVTRRSGQGTYQLTRLDRKTTRAQMRSGSATIDYGDTFSVAGSLSRLDGGNAPGRALIQLTPRWRSSTEYEVDAPGGEVSYEIKPSLRTTVRIAAANTDITAASPWSDSVTVKVRPRFGRVSVSKTSVKAGRSFSVSGDMWPRHPSGTTVWVKAQRFDARGTSLGAPVKLKARVTSSSGDKSHFKGTVHLNKKGRYAFAAYQSADGEHEAGKSTEWGTRPVTVK